jgi:hypothetical protein
VSGPAGTAPRAREHAFDDHDDFLEAAYEQGWTDGLPIVPPTPDKVAATLAAAGLGPDAVLGEVPTRDVVVTAEKAAINAVMAGCRPEYFPVVAAALRAQLAPMGNTHSTTATLAGAAQVVIVNGPVRGRLGIRSGQACFGPGFRANATIGRAVRLTLRNVCRSVPGVLDRASFSTPLRYSFCFGENEEFGDWVPLHVERGYAASDSTVTMCSVMNMPRAMAYTPDPAGILATVAAVARHIGVRPDAYLGEGRSVVVVVGPEHQRRMLDAGWSKRRVREHLWPLLTAGDRGEHDRALSLATPDNILVVAAGGPGMQETHLLLPHLSSPVTEAVV